MSLVIKPESDKFSYGLTEWGKKIRALRIRKNVTLKDMAEHLGVGSAYLSGIEFGREENYAFQEECERYLNGLPESGKWAEPNDFSVESRQAKFDELMAEIQGGLK